MPNYYRFPEKNFANSPKNNLYQIIKEILKIKLMIVFKHFLVWALKLLEITYRKKRRTIWTES